MAIEIRSGVSGETIHIVYRQSSLIAQDSPRIDLGNPSHFLQVAGLRVRDQTSFRPHIHLERNRTFSKFRAMESWVVVKGRVEVSYYDEDGSYIESLVLGPGDVSVTYFGGHGYKTLEENCLFYEFKSGPYEGQEIDKRFL